MSETSWCGDILFVAAQHDTASDHAAALDHMAVPDIDERLVTAFGRDVALAGERLARGRARHLPGDIRKVRVRGHDWAQVRREWGLAGNAAFVIGPRSITAGLDQAGAPDRARSCRRVLVGLAWNNLPA